MLAACFLPDIQTRLEKYELGLESCQQALTEHVESKCIVFPRLYFLAHGEILSMLSKGSNLQAIERSASKCFANVASITFGECVELQKVVQARVMVVNP